jgi:hypothetical protein
MQNYWSELINPIYKSFLLPPHSIKIMNYMDNTRPAKPYFIELYHQLNNTLQNKFKFTLAATTIQQLKNAIADKLISKKEIEPHHQLIIKDNDDFELASDDEPDQVITDSKVKIYIKNSAPQVPSQSQPIIQSHPTTHSQPQQPSSVAMTTVNVAANSNLVSKSTVLDLSKLSIPILGS